jgi:hypothetical protein
MPEPEEEVAAARGRLLSATDAARARAQSGFGIASAIATALLAAGIFTDVPDRSHPARYLGGVALALWLLAMLLYLQAVASPAEPAAPDAAGRREGERWRGRWTVEKALRAAIASTSVAVLATAATVIVGASSLSVDQDRGQLVLTKRGLSAVASACETSPRLHGTLRVATLNTEFVLFRIDKGDCRAARTTPVQIRRDDVLAFREDNAS